MCVGSSKIKPYTHTHTHARTHAHSGPHENKQRSYAKPKANRIPEKKPYTRTAKHLNKHHVVPGCL